MSKLSDEEMARRYESGMASIELQKKKREMQGFVAGGAVFALAPSKKIGTYAYNFNLMMAAILPNILFMKYVLNWF